MKNNKGFTLIELLGVIVVLVAILLVAIPSVASTFERNKDKIDKHKKEIILNAAEVYASTYKLKFQGDDYNEFLKGNCVISINMLLEKELITKEDLYDNSGNEFKIGSYKYYQHRTYVKIKSSSGTYNIVSSGTLCTVN